MLHTWCGACAVTYRVAVSGGCCRKHLHYLLVKNLLADRKWDITVPGSSLSKRLLSDGSWTATAKHLSLHRKCHRWELLGRKPLNMYHICKPMEACSVHLCVCLRNKEVDVFLIKRLRKLLRFPITYNKKKKEKVLMTYFCSTLASNIWS